MTAVATRVLMVDDEPKLVLALQRLLRPHRAEWDITTATSGSEALALMEQRPFEVIVSDMRMPEMDGATLLAAVKARYPGTMRIVLSGQTDAQMAVRAVTVAHQFLSKPMDTAVMLDAFTRMRNTRDALADARAGEAIGGLDALPTPPPLYREMTALMERDDATPAAVAALVGADPAIVLKLLQVVNSTFFGLRRKLSSVEEAIAYLGMALVKSLCLSASIVNALPVRARTFDVAAFNANAFSLASMARLVGGGGELGETSFLAGLLYDVGRLVLASAMPDVYDAIATRARQTGCSFEEAERATQSCGHRKIGAYLLDLWGLPHAVVETLVDCQRTSSPSSELRSPDVLRIALGVLASRDGLIADEEERAYLARVGLLERLPVFVRKANALSART